MFAGGGDPARRRALGRRGRGVAGGDRCVEAERRRVPRRGRRAAGRRRRSTGAWRPARIRGRSAACRCWSRTWRTRAACRRRIGSVPYKDNVVDHDSTHVARLRAAGAVILGKSAAPEFGLVAYTATKLHGVTRNPWNLERTPAGSSGGSAAAVSGGLVPLATASDGGGVDPQAGGVLRARRHEGHLRPHPARPARRERPADRRAGARCSRSVRDTARWFDVTSGYDARDPFSSAAHRRLGARSRHARPARAARRRCRRTWGTRRSQPTCGKVVTEAADALVAATGMQRVEIDVRLPEGGAKWANAGRAVAVQRPEGLLARLQGRPDVRDRLLDGVDGRALSRLARGVGRPIPRAC